MILNILKANRLKKVVSTILTLVVGILLFSACNQEPANKDFHADADIFIQKRMVNYEYEYAASYYLFGNQTMSAGQVLAPNSDVIDLSGGTYTLYKEASEDDFSETMPSSGEYVFTANDRDGETHQFYDIFSGDEIDVPEIDSTSYNAASNDFYVRWLSVSDANVFNVRLYDLSGELIFNGSSLAGDVTEYVFDYTKGTWTSTPTDGEHYTLRLNAFLLDSDATDEDWFYNFECNSYTEKEIVWGE